MSIINVPKYYENERGILKKSGELIKRIGKHSLIIGGNTALNVVKRSLFKSLDESQITYEVAIFTGYPTLKKIDFYEKQVLGNKNDVIIGIGGGKVMDLVKAIGDKVHIPVVTIPTIPATCAAWSALSVIYKDNGEQDVYIYLKNSPELIIADKEVLESAPLRYINSGVADTIVKWYEIHPDLRKNKDNFPLRLQLKICELALEFLKNDYIEAYKNGKLFKTENKYYIDNAIDSIIMLAGFAGSIKGSIPYGGLAHPFYNSSTYIHDIHKLLHGEKVIFGLIVQLILEKRSEKEIYKLIEWMDILNLPITLSHIGINSDAVRKVEIIADKMKEWVGDYSGLDYELTKEDIFKAIFEADRRGKLFSKEVIVCRSNLY